MTLSDRWIRDLLIFLLTTMSVTAGWAIKDRIHWAANEQQIKENTEVIKSLPKVYVTREEWMKAESDMSNTVMHQHDEILKELSDIKSSLQEMNRAIGRVEAQHAH